MKLVRTLLKPVILGLDRLTAPNPPKRDPIVQKALDARTANLTLYHLQACPFCVKVRRQIRRQGLNIRMKEIAEDRAAWDELMAGGKLDQAPCLRIDEGGKSTWMYESSDINAYLEKTFGA